MLKKFKEKQIQVYICVGDGLRRYARCKKKKGAAEYWLAAGAAVVLVAAVAFPVLKTIMSTFVNNLNTWMTANWTKIFTPLS